MLILDVVFITIDDPIMHLQLSKFQISLQHISLLFYLKILAFLYLNTDLPQFISTHQCTFCYTSMHRCTHVPMYTWMKPCTIPYHITFLDTSSTLYRDTLLTYSTLTNLNLTLYLNKPLDDPATSIQCTSFIPYHITIIHNYDNYEIYKAPSNGTQSALHRKLWKEAAMYII